MLSKRARALLVIVAETPLHAGGGSSLGTIDLPIQRERHTQYPVLQASGVKGALRDLAYQRKDISVQARKEFGSEQRVAALGKLDKGSPLEHHEEKILSLEAVFGPDTDRASDHAGALVVTDARLLLFPVRSLQGLFAWVTSPFALERFRRDLVWLGQTVTWQVPRVGVDGEASADRAAVGTGSSLLAGNGADARIVLEECAFAPLAGTAAGMVDLIAGHLAQELEVLGPANGPSAYWRERLWSEDGKTNLVILPDDAFRDFVCFSTEVVSRIRINQETGTVARGALWSEEHLPADSVLYSVVLADASRGPKTATLQDDPGRVLGFVRDVLGDSATGLIQLGGDETVGRGFARMMLRTLSGGAA